MSVLNKFVDERKQAIHFEELFNAIAEQEKHPVDVVAAFFHRHHFSDEVNEQGEVITITNYKCYAYSRINGFDSCPDDYFQERCSDLIRAIGERYAITNEELPGYNFGYTVIPDAEFGLPNDYQGFFKEFHFKYSEIKSFLNNHGLDMPEKILKNDLDNDPATHPRRPPFDSIISEEKAPCESDKPLGSRERNNLHAIIGGLSLMVLMDNEKRNQTYIINNLGSLFSKVEPFSESNLQRVLPTAKFALKEKGYDFDELLNNARKDK